VSIAGTSLEVILASATAAFGAQVFKCIIYLLIHKPVNFRTLVHTGGMPSSHSALVACITTSAGLIEGFHSTLFAVAMGFAVIVMYDAAGLRRAAGKMAGILNQITEDIYLERQGKVPDRLRELLGHTPFEVIVGAFLGITTAYVFHYKLMHG
jgi:acid phosphatase family membrane protein YuiD